MKHTHDPQNPHHQTRGHRVWLSRSPSVPSFFVEVKYYDFPVLRKCVGWPGYGKGSSNFILLEPWSDKRKTQKSEEEVPKGVPTTSSRKIRRSRISVQIPCFSLQTEMSDSYPEQGFYPRQTGPPGGWFSVPVSGTRGPCPSTFPLVSEGFSYTLLPSFTACRLGTCYR